MALIEGFSRYGEDLLDVKEILKQRKERFRIRDSIFEDKVPSEVAASCTSGDGSDRDNDKCGANVAHKVQKIDFKRNGVDIFNSVASQLFDEDSLYDKYFKSKRKPQAIFSLSKEDVYRNILRGLLKQKIKMQDTFKRMSEFLFFLMSGHSSVLLVEACLETLLFPVLTSKPEDHTPWIPSVENIKSVFVNFGASKELLDLNDIPIPSEIISKEQQFEYLPEISPKNIFWVFKFMNNILSHLEEIYSIKELDQLLIMFLVVSLDKCFIYRETHNYIMIAKCIHKILGAYPDLGPNGDEKISEIGKMIYAKMRNLNTNEIHFIVNFCVTCPVLGHRLGQAISYSMINDRVKSLKHLKHFYEVTSKDIKRILCEHKLRDLDYHSQFYILLILDRCITSMIFSTNHQAHLIPISNLLSYMKINLPEGDDTIDYHILKELVTRMSTLWKLSIVEMT